MATAKIKSNFIRIALATELNTPIEMKELNHDYFEFIVGTTVELGKTSMRVDDVLGDCLFGIQTGAFLSREVQQKLKIITKEYNEMFGTNA